MEFQNLCFKYRAQHVTSHLWERSPEAGISREYIFSSSADSGGTGESAEGSWKFALGDRVRLGLRDTTGFKLGQVSEMTQSDAKQQESPDFSFKATDSSMARVLL